MYRETDELKRFQDSIVTPIKAPAKASAVWKVRVMKGNIIMRESAWMKNVIVNRWWDHLATYGSTSGIKGFIAGAGTSSPLETDTGLQSYLGGGNSFQSVQQIVNSTVSPRSTTTVVRIRAGEGAVVGNVAELALYFATGSSSVNPSNSVQIANRVRVTDETGAPTTIPVANDEFLEIECRTTWFAIDGVTGIWELSNKGVLETYNYEIRPVAMFYATLWGTIGTTGLWNPSSLLAVDTANQPQYCKALTQATFVDPSASNSSGVPGWGDGVNNFTQRNILTPYVPGSKATHQRIRLPLNNGNHPAPGIRSLMLSLSGYSPSQPWCCHQMLLETPFVKTGNEILDIPLSVIRGNA